MKQEEVTQKVVDLINERSRIGEVKYGTRLKTFNGRSSLQDALEECLDLSQYLMQRIMEEEARRKELMAIVNSFRYEIENHNLKEEEKFFANGIITGILEAI